MYMYICIYMYVLYMYMYLHTINIANGVQVRLEQRTDEEALHGSEMKKQELLNRKKQLQEQR